MIRVLCLVLLAVTAHADEAEQAKWHREAVQAARQQQFEEAAETEATAWTWVYQCEGRVCVSREQLCRIQPCTKP